MYPTRDEVRFVVQVNLDYEEIQMALTPEQVSAVMNGIAEVMNAEKSRRLNARDTRRVPPQPEPHKATR